MPRRWSLITSPCPGAGSPVAVRAVVAPLPAMHGGVAPTGFHIPAVLEELEGSAKKSLEEIRRAILIAVFSDDVLMELLVLKGDNALELIHDIGERASVDLDFSMREDFGNVEEAQRFYRIASEQGFRSAILILAVLAPAYSGSLREVFEQEQA